MTHVSRIMALATLIGLWSCTKPERSSAIASDISDIDRFVPMLGQAYDSARSVILPQACVHGDVTKVRNGAASIEYMKNVDYLHLVKAVSGELSADTEFLLLSASIGSQMASQHAATQLEETHTIFASVTARSLKFDPSSARPSVFANSTQRAADGSYIGCGDEWLDQLDLGAGLLATLRFSFASIADQRDVSGHLSVHIDTALASAELSGSLENLSTAVRRRTVISLQIHQFGGDPTGLLGVVDTGMAMCTLEDPSPCLLAMARILNYAKTSLPGQLSTSDAYNIIRGHTVPYAESNSSLTGLHPNSESTSNASERAVRRLISDRWLQESSAAARAKSTLMRIGTLVSASATSQLQGLATRATDNAQLLQTAFTDCLEGSGCLFPQALQTYDQGILDHPITPLSNDEVCQRERRFQRFTGKISTDDANRYELLNQAPRYMSPGNRQAPIEGWYSCNLVADSLRPLHEGDRL